MKIQPDNPLLSYSGRIDWNDRKAPVFVFPCTSVAVRFTGRLLRVHVRNRNAYWDNYLGYILDGKQYAAELLKNGESLLEIPVEGDGEHELLLFKRQDSCHEVTFLGLEIGDGENLLSPPFKPDRKMEVYGDSVSAGEVSEAVEYVGQPDPVHNGQYSNSWYSYAWMTARKLDAQIHDIAQGGIALPDGTGWFLEPDALGMESVWDKVHYNPEFGAASRWDFGEYTPQVVVVAIGQNDAHPVDYMKEDYQGAPAVKWRAGYGEFLRRLRGKYPEAHIVCCTTLLGHDASWWSCLPSFWLSYLKVYDAYHLLCRKNQNTLSTGLLIYPLPCRWRLSLAYLPIQRDPGIYTHAFSADVLCGNCRSKRLTPTRISRLLHFVFFVQKALGIFHGNFSFFSFSIYFLKSSVGSRPSTLIIPIA
ncbi:SGNH/GDSL hydrolase family protein [Acetatifactor aquisgranensis]|uniref:electron transporter RnfD n=1 Tax=Acetatifactor aquisgranensis TaxID=2941233 RepID=UPI00204020F0|nr:electron transporter RnfD [Acetatifactor aquisgranensis]